MKLKLMEIIGKLFESNETEDTYSSCEVPVYAGCGYMNPIYAGDAFAGLSIATATMTQQWGKTKSRLAIYLLLTVDT